MGSADEYKIRSETTFAILISTIKGQYMVSEYKIGKVKGLGGIRC